jgi:SAM-dependent methyltransferase
MSQITTGARALLSLPFSYDLLQQVMGINSLQRTLVSETIRPQPGHAILDIGCGTANIAKFLPPDSRYVGFDISERYIQSARRRFPERGPFYARIFSAADLPTLPLFDIAIATSLLHHLDDQEAADLLLLVRRALKPHGRFVTMDPCFTEPQNPIARFLIEKDRGCNVREPSSYARLAHAAFPKVTGSVRHRAWIPYTHWTMECTAP